MRTLMRTVLIVLLAPIASAQSNQPAPAAAPKLSPLISASMGTYEGIKKVLARTAELMPEENYSFKPAEDVRSFGQILGHVADAQYFFCSIVLDEKSPSPGAERSMTAKADLIKALSDAFAYCDRAYEGMTDTSAVEMVKFMGGDNPKLGVLNTNQIHSIEHYGNLVTYMRIRGFVPPTSDPAFMKELMK